jgi:hypothetical protein
MVRSLRGDPSVLLSDPSCPSSSTVSSSNIICRIFLEGSVLKAWKRASGPAVDPLELAARAAPIQALIDTLLGGSFEESLKMFGYDYFSSPFRTMKWVMATASRVPRAYRQRLTQSDLQFSLLPNLRSGFPNLPLCYRARS